MAESTRTGADNPGQGTQPGTEPNAGGQISTVKTYTQEEVNRLVGERAAREKAKYEKLAQDAAATAVSQYRDEQGLTDDVLGRLQGQDETATELRKLQRETAKERRAREELQAKHERAHGKLVNTLTKNAVLSEAQGKSVDPESVYLHLQNRLKVEDDYTVTVLDEHGEPAHGSSIGDLVTNLLEQKPHLAAPTGQSGSGSRPGSNGQAPQGPDLKTADGRRKALQEAKW